MSAPIITIFVRHSLDCQPTGNEFYKRCDCWKHLRSSYGGRQYRRAPKEKAWAGAERVEREIELSYEAVEKPIEPDRPATLR